MPKLLEPYVQALRDSGLWEPGDAAKLAIMSEERKLKNGTGGYSEQYFHNAFNRINVVQPAIDLMIEYFREKKEERDRIEAAQQELIDELNQS